MALLCEALSTPSSLILVEGEAGIGKSRLVREAVCSPAVEGRRVLRGCCHRLRDPFLLGPIVDALRRAGDEPLTGPVTLLLGALRPLLPELAGMLPPELAPIGDVRAERHRVFRALRELFEVLGPTVCVLEDLHWADEGTLEFLDFLLSELPGALGLVLTYRAEDSRAVSPIRALASRIHDGTLKLTVELSALAVQDVGRLACAMLGAEAISEEVARELHRWTAGNPLVLEEVIRMLRDQGQLVLDEGRLTSAPTGIDVPPTIRGTVRERLDKLDRDGRVIAQAAAVLARPMDEDLLLRVAGLPRGPGSRALTNALSSGLLQEEPDGRFWFRHVLAAEAVQAEIPAPERRRLHLRAARSLEKCPEPRPLARLAYHFREAKLASSWTRYAEAAADAATSIGDDREAARLLLEVLSGPGLSRARRVENAVKLGAAALYSVSPRPAIDVLQRTLAEVQGLPGGVRGELRCSLARLQSHAGDSSWREEMVR
ncbi:MAG: ATP-binding protein, partial [Solirubrobacteraceae bacterium]